MSLRSVPSLLRTRISLPKAGSWFRENGARDGCRGGNRPLLLAAPSQPCMKEEKSGRSLKRQHGLPFGTARSFTPQPLAAISEGMWEGDGSLSDAVVTASSRNGTRSARVPRQHVTDAGAPRLIPTKDSRAMHASWTHIGPSPGCQAEGGPVRMIVLYACCVACQPVPRESDHFRAGAGWWRARGDQLPMPEPCQKLV